MQNRCFSLTTQCKHLGLCEELGSQRSAGVLGYDVFRRQQLGSVAAVIIILITPTEGSYKLKFDRDFPNPLMN